MRECLSFLISTVLVAGCESATGPSEYASEAGASPIVAQASIVNGQITYSRDDPATGAPQIFSLNPDGTGEHQLPLPYAAAVPVWSPDGSNILVTPFRPDAPLRPGIVHPDGSGLRVFEVLEVPADVDVLCKAWSPDGRLLLCQVISFSGDNTRDGIYTIRASDGGGLTRLTVNPSPPAGDFGGGDLPGSYSPDGSQFVFMRAKPSAGPVPDRNQKGALFVEHADGSGLRQITPYGLANSHDDGVAHWSPDGRDILFASERGSLFIVHVDGTGVRKIPLHAGGGFSFVRAPAWSPDGRRIVFSLFRRKTGQFDLYTANADGGEIARLTDTPEFEDFASWGTHPPTAMATIASAAVTRPASAR